MKQFTYDDKATWDLICSGLTDGCFQIESNLLKSWLKRIKPRSLYELAATISIIRPGPVSQAGTFADVKNGIIEPIPLGHKEIDSILSATWNVLIYQETLMNIAHKVAYPEVEEIERQILVENLRKKISKKVQSEVLKLGKDFRDGCVKNGVPQDIAERLFQIIQDAGRYAFCYAHGMIYSHVAYKTAWQKANYPLQTLAVHLTYSEFKNSIKKHYSEELSGEYRTIHDLVRCAQKRDIVVLPPNINCKNTHFAIEGNAVRYGLKHIKSLFAKDMDVIKKFDKIDSFSKFIIACNTDIYGKYLNKKTINSLILSGAFSDLKIGRRILSNIQKLLESLTERELKVITENIDKIDTPQSLIDFMPEVIKIANKGRREKLESLTKLCDILEWDHPAFIEESERQLLGIPLTASSADLKDNTRYDKCSDCYEELPERTIKEVMVVIQNVRLTTIKNGKNAGKTMAKISVYDSSGNLEIPVFSELYEACSDILIAKNIISLNLLKGKQGWIANGIHRA